MSQRRHCIQLPAQASQVVGVDQDVGVADKHEAILAEGLAVETFLGNNRDAFENADVYVRLYGSSGETLMPFAPIAS